MQARRISAIATTLVGHCLFCHSPAPNVATHDLARFMRFVRHWNTVFAFVDLLNLFLDSFFALRLVIEGRRVEGGFLWVGIGLAYLAGYCGRRLMFPRVEGQQLGMNWAPFCQNPQTYYQRGNEDVQMLLRMLFTLSFTELAMFLFEDTTTVLVFLSIGETDLSWLDQANLCTTLLSAILATLLLLLTLIYSIGCCSSCYPTTPITLMSLTVKFVFQGVLACLFLILFGVVLVVVGIAILVSTNFLFQYYNMGPTYDDGTGPELFVLSVTVMWLIGTYFLHKLICRRRLRDGSNHHQGDEEEQTLETNYDGDDSETLSCTSQNLNNLTIAEEERTLENDSLETTVPVDEEKQSLQGHDTDLPLPAKMIGDDKTSETADALVSNNPAFDSPGGK